MLGKLKTIIIIMLMVFSVSTMAFAVEDNTTNTTEDDADVVVTRDRPTEDDSTQTNTTDDEAQVDDSIQTNTTDDSAQDDVSIQTNTTDDSAQNESEIEVSEEETEILSVDTGVELKLLQLKSVIDVQIDGANLILGRIVENNNSEAIDISTLERIVADLEGLLVRIDELDMNQDVDVLAQEFVAIKAEGISLSKEFKTVLIDKLNEQRDDIKQAIKESKDEASKKKDDRIEDLKESYKVTKAGSWIEALGFDVEEIRDNIESGEITLKEVESMLKDKFNSLSPEDKRDVKLIVKEEEQKLKVQLDAKRDDFKANAKARRDDLRDEAKLRRDEFIMNAKAKRDDLKDQIKQIKNNLKGQDKIMRDDLAQMDVGVEVSN